MNEKKRIKDETWRRKRKITKTAYETKSPLSEFKLFFLFDLFTISICVYSRV